MEFYDPAATWRRYTIIITTLLWLLTLSTVTLAQGPICRVDVNVTSAGNGSTWAAAYEHLQDALAQINCTEIWVAAGLYYPDVTSSTDSNDVKDSFALKNGVGIYGGFTAVNNPSMRSDRNPNPASNGTILSGDITQNDPSNVIDDPRDNPGGTFNDPNGDNSVRIVTGSAIDNTAILDGFTITGGSGYDGDTFTAYPGAGIYLSDADPTLRNLRIRGNSFFTASTSPGFDDGGAGMHTDGNSNPTLENIEFSSNYTDLAGGGLYNSANSFPILNHVFFIGNFADSVGGGLFNEGSLSLINVAFQGNLASSEGNTTFISADPEAQGGGLYNYADGKLTTLASVLFSGNKARGDGGGLYNDLGELFITNATFSNNEANRGGAIFHQSPTDILLQNSILWDNEATDVSDQGEEIYNDDKINVASSIVMGGITGPRITNGVDAAINDNGGNIASDPGFVTPDVSTPPSTAGNFRLNTGSPAIDTGDGSLLYDGFDPIASIATDLDASSRSKGCIDRGPYESTDSSGVCLITLPPFDNLTPSGTVTATGTALNCGAQGDGTCQVSVATNAEVTLNAIAEVGYAFNGWQGDCSGSANRLIFTITANRTCTAEFIVDESTLTITPTPSNGVVTALLDSSPVINCGGANTNCSVTLLTNATVSLTATPDPDYKFQDWTGDCAEQGATYLLSLSADKSCGANFVPNITYSLTISPVPSNGTITGNGLDCGAAGTGICSQPLAENTFINLTASGESGFALSAWGGDVVCTTTGITNPLGFNLSANTTCTASFESGTTLKIDPKPTDGTISDAGSSGLNCGSGGDLCEVFIPSTAYPISLNAAPANVDQELGAWSGDCSGNNNPLSLTPSSNATTCGASFQDIMDTLTISPEPTGATVTATADGSPTSLNCGTGGDICSVDLNPADPNAIVLSITTDSGFLFSGWGGGCDSNFPLVGDLTCQANVVPENPLIHSNGFE